MLEVNITHPDLNKDSNDLVGDKKQFLIEHLKMERRSIDANMEVRKCPRDNTVTIKCSNIRYKRFLYTANKKLRAETPNNNLYINDNLTTYNYDILKQLKTARKRLIDQGAICFDSVYTFDGKVFIKKSFSDNKENAICIRNRQESTKLIQGYEASEEAATNDE